MGMGNHQVPQSFANMRILTQSRKGHQGLPGPLSAVTRRLDEPSSYYKSQNSGPMDL